MKKYRISKVVLGVIAVTIVLAAGLLCLKEINLWDAGDDDESVSEESEQSDEPELPVEEKEYPQPEYDFKTDEIVVEIDGLEREYTIAFVNDLHMITDHASGDVTEDNMAVVRERYETLAVTEDGVFAEYLWHEVIKYLNYNDFDAVIFAGDMLDYCSNSNIIALKSGLKELKYPSDKLMYIRSDHDYGGWYGGSGFTDSNGFSLQTLVLDGDATEKVIEFDDFIIVGINQSYRNVSEHAREVIDRNIARGKPVIIATHVPFYSDVDSSLEELSMEVRNKIYYWSKDGVNYVPDGETQALIDAMYADDSNVEQIVAAHMHASWDGYVTDRLKEHIFAPAFQGNIGIIYVTGGKES